MKSSRTLVGIFGILFGLIFWLIHVFDEIEIERYPRFTIGETSNIVRSSDRYGKQIIGFTITYTISGITYNQNVSWTANANQLEEPKKWYILKYSYENPIIINVLRRLGFDALTSKNIPSNGISPDSLQYFLSTFNTSKK